MTDPGSSDGYLGLDAFDHLKVEPDGVCWWCRVRPATTGEHKFKRTDLARLMGDDHLIYGVDGTGFREIRGRSGITRDRYGVIKFPKSMCERCNNQRSKNFDEAYESFSSYCATTHLRIMPGIDFTAVYGSDWREGASNLARYYAKHFACRMDRTGLPVPPSLRAFLDGADDMSDGHMGLISTDSVHKRYGDGLFMSPEAASTDQAMTYFRSFVAATYIGGIGVRYEWQRDGISNADRSQFFHFPHPVLNYFRTDLDVAEGQTRRPGWFARFSQWLNQP